jgi:formylglycine-generating enzyme required for sulfatase activity
VAHAHDVSWRAPGCSQSSEFVDLPSGLHPIGFAGEGYCFDNEQTAHGVYLQPERIARALVNNGQWLEFIAEGGYTTPSLWLSDGWGAVEAEGRTAPGYRREHDGDSTWHALTLGGLAPIDPNAPVTHVSYYEADAFARWAGKHLPTESEWELATRRRLRRGLTVDP